MWYVHLQRFVFLKPQVPYVSYHTYDHSFLSFEIDRDALAERIFLRPVTAGNSVIDDRDPRGLLTIILSKKVGDRRVECTPDVRQRN